MEKRKSICFAYFGDGKFLGWYADSFGSIRESSPKIYGNSKEQIETITKNFNYKLSKIDGEYTLSKRHPAFGLIDNSLEGDSKILYPCKRVELKIVECPIYDGPNPDFDKDSYDKLREKRRMLMEDEGIFNIPAPSIERTLAISEFDERHPMPKKNSWIYADYDKVKEWAKNEPTEFIGEILREVKV